jgi:hypothetical protein
MEKIVSVFGLALLLSGSFGQAQSQPNDPCAKVERTFPKVISSARSWDDVYRAYRTFAVCQRPYMYEGFSNVIVHLLATRWHDLPECRQHADTDPGFGDFVVEYIGPVDYYELKSIVEHAQLETRPDMREFVCRLAAKAQKLLDASQYTIEPAAVSEYERFGKPVIK